MKNITLENILTTNGKRPKYLLKESGATCQNTKLLENICAWIDRATIFFKDFQFKDYFIVSSGLRREDEGTKAGAPHYTGEAVDLSFIHGTKEMWDECDKYINTRIKNGFAHECGLFFEATVCTIQSKKKWIHSQITPQSTSRKKGRQYYRWVSGNVVDFGFFCGTSSCPHCSPAKR